MKTALACIVAIVIGISAGTAAGLLTYSNPGPDFEWMKKPLVYDPVDLDVEEGIVEFVEVVGGEEFDFGVMDRGETRNHTFTIKNETTRPMFPVVTGTTCKCTVGDMDESRIGPGEEGKVKLEWIAKSLDTEFRQTATIETGNEVRPDIALSVFGRVIQMVDARPRTLAFSDVSLRDERAGEVVIYAFEDDRLTIVEEEWSDKDTVEFYEFEWRTAPDDVVEKMEDCKSAVICHIKLKPGLPLGSAFQELRLKTSSSKAGMIEIPISANIVGDLSISGRRYNKQLQLIRMGPVNATDGMETKISLMVKGQFAPEFEILGVETDPADEKTLAVNIGETREFRDGKIKMIPVTVTVPQGAPSTNYLGGVENPTAKIKFKTNHPDAKELTVAVEFSVVN